MCSTNPTTVSLWGHRREIPPDDGQERALSSEPSTVKRGPKETQRYPQLTNLRNTKRRGQRERKGCPEHHFLPYWTPQTANMQVGKTNGGSKTQLDCLNQKK
ncbi:hypothetical protein TNCV_2413391 [Trichonephila clavipes]|nr:hypothetical protein TNCV_2413391 [Trichonephila clavipes]